MSKTPKSGKSAQKSTATSAGATNGAGKADAIKKAAEDLKAATGSVSEEALNAARAAEAKEQKKLPSSAEKIAAFGNAVWLMMHSKTHKHLFVTDMEWACEHRFHWGNVISGIAVMCRWASPVGLTCRKRRSSA